MQLKDLLPEKGSGHSRMLRRDFNWEKFWLFEVIILAVPTLVTVFAMGGHSGVSPLGVEVLLFVLVVLTIVNLFLRTKR